MNGDAPEIEPRSIAVILEDLHSRLALRRDREDLVDLLEKLISSGGGKDPLGEAIMRVFTRYCELIIERLNQVPEKHYRAFLNMLGISPTPPFPAEVPLTFQPVKQFSRIALDGREAYVPARTQVAAASAEGQGEPIVFETERPLKLTSASLQKAIAIDPQTDMFADLSSLVRGEQCMDVDVFAGHEPVKHQFFLGLVGIPKYGLLSQLRLDVLIMNPCQARPKDFRVEWFIGGPKEIIVLQPTEDTTYGLTKSGQFVFDNLPVPIPQKILDKNCSWLGCRLLKPLEAKSMDRAPMWLPRIAVEPMVVIWESSQAAIQYALFNGIPLDKSKDFFPLGQHPHFGDTLYLGSDTFSHPGLKIILDVALTNPASAGDKSPIPATYRLGHPELLWETLIGDQWVTLDISDGTQAFTESGFVTFTMPPGVALANVNSVESGWIRVRLIGGHYGQDEQLELFNPSGPGQGFRRSPATLAPPSIRSIGLTCANNAQFIVTENNFLLEGVDLCNANSFLPFRQAETSEAALYVALSVPDPRILCDSDLDLFIFPGVPVGRTFVRSRDNLNAGAVTLQYWDGNHWKDCLITRDDTDALVKPGIISIRLEDDLSHWLHSALDPECEYWWIRIVWQGSGGLACPRLRRIALNTIPSWQGSSLQQELLGSSNGSPNQGFRTLRVPIVGKLSLEVRETDVQSDKEIAALISQFGPDAVSIARDSRGSIEEVWVCWQEVKTLRKSGALDRHFSVDHLAGIISFGDGVHGRIPNRGDNNVRLKHYRTGGGARGNQPASVITQLRTSIPFVDSVVNLEPATGGQDAEDWGAIRARGSRWLRHRDRAVTIEDFQDLAMRASPEVAIAKCHPLRDLAKDPSGTLVYPGVVSVVIVPRTSAHCPKPGPVLLKTVKNFLECCCAFEVDLVVLGPEYVRVSVDVECSEGGQATAGIDPIATCENRLNAYLNALDGNSGGRGWDFGQKPHSSDLYAVLGSIPGFDGARSLTIGFEEERPGLLADGTFLVCPGTHRIRVNR